MDRTSTLLALFAGTALTIACSASHERNVLAPTSAAAIASGPAAAGSNAAPQSLVGTWSSANAISAQATLPTSLSQCSNMNLSITSQTSTLATGTLTMTCPGGMSVAGTIMGQLGAPTIPIRYAGTATLAGQGCAFQMDGTGYPLGGNNFRFDYTGTSCLGPIYGSELLRFGSSAGAPPPAAAPGAPTAPSTASAADAVPLSSMIVRGSPQFGNWPITTALTVVDIAANGIHVEFSKKNGPGRWPDWTPPGWNGPLQYSLGMALNIGGQWYASSPIEFWNGLDRAGGPPSKYALNWFYDPGRWAPMTTHQPAVGETIGFFVVAGDARGRLDGSGSPVKERSNVVLVRMPTDAGGRFTF